MSCRLTSSRIRLLPPGSAPKRLHSSLDLRLKATLRTLENIVRVASVHPEPMHDVRDDFDDRFLSNRRTESARTWTMGELRRPIEVGPSPTPRSGDERGLGDIGVVAVVDENSDGEELWRLALSLGGRVSDEDRARWILTQAHRARMVNAYTDLLGSAWAAGIRRRFELSSLFANHDVLMTGGVRRLAGGVTSEETPPVAAPFGPDIAPSPRA